MPANFNFYLFICLFLLGKFNSFGQHPNQISFHYDNKKGLPEKTIYNIHFSSDNYLYLGTESGMYKFNGAVFKYIPIIGNLSSALTDIKEGSDGLIYARNFNNQIFRLVNDTLRNFNEVFESNDFQGGSSSYKILGDKLFFKKDSNYISVDIYTGATELFKPKVGVQGVGDFSISDFLVDSNGIIEYAANVGLFFYEKNRFFPFSLPGGPGFEVINGKYFVYAKNILTTFKYGILNQNGKLQFFEINLPNNPLIYHITQFKNLIWICTNKGLFRFYPEENRAEFVALPNEQVTDIKLDNENNYWISTLQNGIFFIPANSPKTFFEIPKQLNEKITHLSFESSTGIQVSTNQGNVVILDPKTSAIKTSNSNTLSRSITLNKYQEKFNFSLSTFGFFLNNKWIGDKITPFYMVSGDFLNDTAYVSTAFKVFKFPITDIIQKKSKNEAFPLLNYSEIANKRARTIATDSINRLVYIGLNDGLIVYDANTNLSEPILFSNGDRVILTDCFFDYTINALVASTFQKGVVLISNKKITSIINANLGLASNHIFKVRKGPNGFFLISKQGIDFYSYTGKLIHFSKQIGFLEYSVSDMIYFDSTVYLATDNQILQTSWPGSKFNSKLNLTLIDITIGDKNIFINDSIKLYAPVNDVKIRYNGNNFSSFGQWVYQYRIVSRNPQRWIDLPSITNEFSLLGLPPGKHDIEMRMLLPNEGVSSKVTKLSFELLPPFYKTNWFIAISSMFGLFVFFVFLKWRLSILKKQQNEQLTLEKLQVSLSQSQLATLRSQMNPHFMYNVLNSVQSFIFSDKKMEANHYLGIFSDLMRKVLNNSAKQDISLSEEIETLKLYLQLEALRFEDGFKYELNIDDKLDDEMVFLPSMIIQPFVENAFKHGLLHKKSNDRLLIINIVALNMGLQVTIIDNGIGRVESARINARKKFKPASFATTAITNRIDLLNKTRKLPIKAETIDLYDDQNRSIGTKVIISIFNEFAVY